MLQAFCKNIYLPHQKNEAIYLNSHIINTYTNSYIQCGMQEIIYTLRIGVPKNAVKVTKIYSVQYTYV